MGLGPWEIFWIFLAILLIFGGKKIPEIARAMGKGMNEFNKAKREITESLNEPETDYKNPEKEIKEKEIKTDKKDTDKK
jgi:TatA/E family protein of Tat protein translocase